MMTAMSLSPTRKKSRDYDDEEEAQAEPPPQEVQKQPPQPPTIAAAIAMTSPPTSSASSASSFMSAAVAGMAAVLSNARGVSQRILLSRNHTHHRSHSRNRSPLDAFFFDNNQAAHDRNPRLKEERMLEEGTLNKNNEVEKGNEYREFCKDNDKVKDHTVTDKNYRISLSMTLTALAILLGTPFVIWDGFDVNAIMDSGSGDSTTTSPTLTIIIIKEALVHVQLVWTSLLHCSMVAVALCAWGTGAYAMRTLLIKPKQQQQHKQPSKTTLLRKQKKQTSTSSSSTIPSSSPPPPPSSSSLDNQNHHKKKKHHPTNLTTLWATVYVVAAFTLLIVVLSQLQVVFPSWLWNPFLLWTYPIYKPHDIRHHMQTLCLDDHHNNNKPEAKTKTTNQPLCLSKDNWLALSSGVLQADQPEQVDTVMRGIHFARTHKLVVAVLSRDTADAIPFLRANVEDGMAPFFQHVSVVVYENDSSDGTRTLFKQWAAEVNKDTIIDTTTTVAGTYNVDLISCGNDNPDCITGMSHRYDSTEAANYFTSSAIGKMADFRQRIVDYVTTEPHYKDYSHMIVIDIDLKVSFSPLGLMHTLGLDHDLAQHYAIASTGRQTWPGSLGTLTPQYDFSAFRALETPHNQRLLRYHRAFCALLPPGDRWRNQCDAISPMHLFLVLQQEHFGQSHPHHAPYAVESAFNGATLYPLDLIQRSHALYDAGDDLQRCEHIGFNKSLKQPLMYVNPLWDFHLMPTNPGGPTGYRAIRNVLRIVLVPRLSLVIFFQNVIFMSLFAYSLVVLGMGTVQCFFVWNRAATAARVASIWVLVQKKWVWGTRGSSSLFRPRPQLHPKQQAQRYRPHNGDADHHQKDEEGHLSRSDADACRRRAAPSTATMTSTSTTSTTTTKKTGKGHGVLSSSSSHDSSSTSDETTTLMTMTASSGSPLSSTSSSASMMILPLTHIHMSHVHHHHHNNHHCNSNASSPMSSGAAKDL